MSFLATIGLLTVIAAIVAGFYVGNSDFRQKVDAVIAFFRSKPSA